MPSPASRSCHFSFTRSGNNWTLKKNNKPVETFSSAQYAVSSQGASYKIVSKKDNREYLNFSLDGDVPKNFKFSGVPGQAVRRKFEHVQSAFKDNSCTNYTDLNTPVRQLPIR